MGLLNPKLAWGDKIIELSYYIQLWTNAHGKCINSLIPASNGLNRTSTYLLRGWLLA